MLDIYDTHIIKMLTANNTSYQLKATGTKTTVPDNPICKFKYYLNCLFKVVDISSLDPTGIIRSLTDYSNPSTSSEEIQLILKLSVMLSPDHFIDKCIIVDDNAVPQGWMN